MGRTQRPADAVASLPLVATDVTVLLRTIAHELRGPLTALTASAELLMADGAQLQPAELQRLVGGLQQRTIWLQELVENLLCAASLQTGRFQLHRQPLDLLVSVREVQAVVEPLLRQRDQRLHIRTRNRPPRVWADGRRIGQVLLNLLLNASKFSRLGATIDLRLESRGDVVRVAVLDQGPGLPSGGAARLFEPFSRGGTARDGVGLGLAIVRAIIVAHGGRVGAANRRGGGAQFWFELPAAEESPNRS